MQRKHTTSCYRGNQRCNQKQKSRFAVVEGGPTHMGVVVHDQQVLGPPLWTRPLVCGDEPGDVVVLQQRQPVNGALIEEVLPIGCSEHLHSHRPLIQGATVDGAISATPNQLKEGMAAGQEELLRGFFVILNL